MKKTPFIGALLLPAMLVLMISSCTRDIKNSEEESSVNGVNGQATAAAKKMAGMDELLKSVRAATSRFNSTVQAIRAGYEPSDHCVPNMGYHWVNTSLVDPVFDPLKPEAILYAKGPGGNLRMVGVEYIVIKSNLPRPMFGNHQFDDGGTPIPAPHWSLHVWLYEENPNGMFVNYNPSITCQ
jgi:hypothetical protein